ncbi:MAG: outer membrane protein assembly factor BamA, partial [Rickettsiaceae bacterium]|nr:outer membrane protein assembly factor BamA [Rickettsiaceae bacterium]
MRQISLNRITGGVLQYITKIFLVIIVASCNIYAAEQIKEINVVGNQRVEIPTIQEYTGLNVGDTYDAVKHNKAIKTLYDTSLFENVEIKFRSGTLTVYVKETPFISKVVFRGNTKVKGSTLSDEIMTAAGDSLRKAYLKTDVAKIKEIYKKTGRFSVKVEVKREDQENNRVKIIFVISEGPKTGIKKIYFVGNKYYKATELKTVILSKESRWFRFLETNDAYDPDRIEYDKYLLARFYKSVGFPDVRIISVTADLSEKKDGFTLTYSIDEGAKYRFGEITYENKLSNIDDKIIAKFIPRYGRRTFNMTKMEKVSEKIADYLASHGYPQVSVYPDIKTNLADKTVAVKIVIDQADQIFVNKIKIEGNLKTQDNVIRRQFKIAEGDLYSRSKVEAGERNLYNLDYFNKIFVRPSPTGEKDRYDLNINVEEKSTSSIGFEVGYNTLSGPIGAISFLEKNLVGTGRYLHLRAQFAKASTRYMAGITDPNFLDKNLSLSNNVFYSKSGSRSGFVNGSQNYSLNSVGTSVSLGYDVVEDLYHEIEYSLKRDIMRASPNLQSRFIVENMGTFITSAIGHSLTLNKADNRMLPKNGYILSGSQEYAGVGGDTKYIKHDASSKFFISFFENKYTVKLTGNAGDIRGVSKQKVRISDRFNLGEHTLRGFSFGGVGP